MPVTVQPEGGQALLMGDNSGAPRLEFIEDPDDITPGDRVVTSGDGGLFPSGLLVGHVVVTPDGVSRVRLAADFARLNFLRVMRSHPGTTLSDPGGIIGPPWPLDALGPEVIEPVPIPVPRNAEATPEASAPQ